MLTPEMIKQSPVLSGLTEEQLKALTEMSRNDENTVIGTRIGALHGQYDNDILTISGIKKNDSEKSYDYLKRVLTEYKSKTDVSEPLKKQLEEANLKIADLQSKIENGTSDKELTQQLNDTKALVEQLQGQLKKKEKEISDNKANFDELLKNTHVDYAFNAATTGLKFKEGITKPIQETLLSAAKSEVLAKGKPDFIDDGNGGKRLVLRGADGNILNNPKNNLNPYTIEELVMETSIKDVIDNSKTVRGGGTKGNGNSNNKENIPLDLSVYRTQLEADKAIETHLLQNGYTRDSLEFSEELVKIRTEGKVNELPIR
jgi:hypothetical protein